MDHRLIMWHHELQLKPNRKVDPLQKVVETGPWKYLSCEAWVHRLRSAGWKEAADALNQQYSGETLKPATSYKRRQQL